MFIRRRSRCNRGFTLLEVITTIVILAIAASAILGVYSYLVSESADPVIQQQGLAIAEAYMEEIRLKPFVDPNGGEPEASRDEFDDVNDYHGLDDSPPRNQTGGTWNFGNLGDYRVQVEVVNAALDTIALGNSLQITVTVEHPAIAPIVLTSFRTNYR